MESSKKNIKVKWQKLFILLGIVAVIIVEFKVTPFAISDFTPDKVKDFILQFVIWSPILFIIIYALRGIVLVIPVGVISNAGGLAFGK